MDLYSRINILLASRESSEQLDKFVDELRGSIAGSAAQFIAYPVLIVIALITYLFSTRLGASVSFSGIQLADADVVRRAFLVVPAALLTAYSAVGYLRKSQRVVYEHIVLPRYMPLHKARLHNLRLPPDYMAGLFLIHEEGGRLGKVVSITVTLLIGLCFLLGPAAFIVIESIRNLVHFGISDLLSTAAAFVSILLCLCSVLIVHLTGSIKVEAPTGGEDVSAP